jgi:DNA-binding MarR family transcriptional regulator
VPYGRPACEEAEQMTAIDEIQLEPGDAPVNLGPLAGYLAFHLRLAEGASFRAFQRIAGVPDLRPGWFAVLTLIAENPGITPMALARGSGRDKSTITPVLRDLERDRLVSRAAVPGDRRSYALSLTAEGEARLAHLGARAAEHERRLEAIVGGRKPELIALLRRIAAELDEG